MPKNTPARPRGFTLIELMIGISVVGIVSSIAVPSFESQLHKSRRSDVLVATMTVQAAQERFRSNGTGYGSLAEIGVPSASPAKHYTLQVSANDAEGFELLATANGAQWRDAGCRYMKLASSGMNLVHRSGPDASVANDASANQKCWSL
jgi:type IV pilus assembly protein PilE